MGASGGKDQPPLPPARVSSSGAQRYPISEGRSCGRFHIRHLERGDYNRGFLQLLSQLTTVGEVSAECFNQQLERVENSNGTHNIIVVVDKATDQVVASGACVVEFKFIHECGKVGHIEDVVVDRALRGQKMGQRIVEALQEVATNAGCYKIILDCDRSNAPFYKQRNFYEKEVQMRYDCHSPRTFMARSAFLTVEFDQGTPKGTPTHKGDA